jgi:hypothetical protein
MPIITNVVQIIIQGTVSETGGSGKNVFNVFTYFQNPNQPGPPTAVAVANVFLTNVWAAFAPLISIAWVPTATMCRYLDITTNPLLAAAIPTGGGKALPRLPSQQAVVTPFRTSLRGKNYRGSKHWGPIDTASVTSDELTAAAVTAWTAQLPNLLANLPVGGQTFSPCVVSRSLSQLARDPVTINGAIITQALLNKTIGTMRRRKEKTVR